MYLHLPGCVALHQNGLWKHGADEAAADRSRGSHSAEVTSQSCATGDWRELKAALPVREVPEKELWRLGILDSLLRERGVLEKEGRDTKRVIAMLASICST